ncbi:MAG: TRAP transporter small permease [Geminicoccales bacterium]
MTTGFPSKNLSAIAERFLGWLLPFMRLASALLLLLMMILTFVDVVGRYVFTAPVFGAAEMIQFLLAMTIFAGLALVNASDDHISVDLFDHSLSRLLPRLRPLLIQLFSLIAMIIIAYQLTEFAIEAQQNNRITVVLEWPLAAVAFAIAGLSCLSLLAQILGLLSRAPADTGNGSASL